MSHVSDLTRRTGSAKGCLGCGSIWDDDEIDDCTCRKCLCRAYTQVETHWYVDKFNTHVPKSVIDFTPKPTEGKTP